MDAQRTMADLLSEVIAADDLVMGTLMPILYKHSISLEIFRALRHLGVHEDGLTVGELGRLIACTPPATTRIVDRLVSDGLVYRRSDPLDRRKVMLGISDTGVEQWVAIESAVAARRTRGAS